MESLKRLNYKLFYSKESSFILNHATLQIKDAEISKKFADAQCQNLHRLYNQCLGAILLNLLARTILYFTEDNAPPIRILSAVSTLIFVIGWGLLKCRKTPQAPRFVWVYLLSYCVFTNLSYRDQLPWWLAESDKKADEDSILVNLLVAHTLNYDTFLVTVLLQPSIVLLSYLGQLLVQVELWTDPYTAEPLESADKKFDFVFTKMTNMAIVVSALTWHHYLTQRNMALIVIEKQMIFRQ